MSESNKTAPTFSFGQAGTSASSGSPFGQPASTSSKPAGGLFGSTTNPPASSGASLFGNTPTAGGAPLFGGTSGTSQAPAFGSGTSGGGLFGGGNKPSGGALFGQAASQNKTPSTSAPSTTFPGFSSFTTPSKPAEPSTTGQNQPPSLFGGTSGGGGSNMNTTTPTSKPITSLFGNSTTPAGPPPNATTGANSGSSLFSTSAAPGSGFSRFSLGSSKQPDSSTATSGTQPPSILGSAPSTSTSDIFGKRAAQSEGGLFQNLNKAQDTGATKPAGTQQQQNEAPKAANPFSLGGQSSTQPSNTQASTASLFGNAGSKPAFSFPKTTQSQPSENPTNSPIAKPALNSFNQPSSSAASAPSTTAPSLFSLGNPQDKPATTSTETTTTSAPSSSGPAPTSSLFSLGNSANPNTTTQTPSQPAATSTAQGAGAPNANLGASTAGPLPAAQSRLKNKSMDDIITRWATDLSKYQKEFQQQAEKVANWDRMLVENSEKIQKLYGNTLQAERATTEVERQLTVVEGDQAELAHWLDHYEREVDSMISNTIGQDGALSGPDQERERTYQIASKLSERLDEMGKDLTGMIEEINDASSTLSKNNKTDDPLSQVVRVLNSHLTQLQQIDQGTAALQLKVRQAQHSSQTLGPSNGLSGPNSDAADGFYRSYMGRR